MLFDPNQTFTPLDPVWNSRLDNYFDVLFCILSYICGCSIRFIYLNGWIVSTTLHYFYVLQVWYSQYLDIFYRSTIYPVATLYMYVGEASRIPTVLGYYTKWPNLNLRVWPNYYKPLLSRRSAGLLFCLPSVTKIYLIFNILWVQSKMVTHLAAHYYGL